MEKSIEQIQHEILGYILELNPRNSIPNFSEGFIIQKIDFTLAKYHAAHTLLLNKKYITCFCTNGGPSKNTHDEIKITRDGEAAYASEEFIKIHQEKERIKAVQIAQAKYPEKQYKLARKAFIISIIAIAVTLVNLIVNFILKR